MTGMLVGDSAQHLKDIIKGALSLERNGEAFYRRAAEVTQHPQGKKMFRRLADQEQGHGSEIGILCLALIGSEAWEKLRAEEAANPQPSLVVSQLEAAVAARGHGEVADDTQALRLAMEMERRALKFFEDLKEHSTDKAVRSTLDQLADEERFHYDIIQAQLDSVLNVGIWLDTPEFRQDGKF